MTFFKSLPIFIFLLLVNYTHAATFDIRNNCPFTVWAAAIPVGGGRQLGQGQTWSINIPGGTAGGRIWARTNCNFDGSGRGRCQTGDCNGLLQCQGSGQPPATLAEFSLNQFNNLDFYDISVINGFNVPMEFSPNSSPNSGGCKDIRCTGNINGQCPAPLRVPGGCNNIPSDVPTDFSRYFKSECPDAYTYSKDTSTFSCPGGTNYRVVFCP